MKVNTNLPQQPHQNHDYPQKTPPCFSLLQSCSNLKNRKCKVGYDKSKLEIKPICSNCYLDIQNLSSVDYSDMLCEFEEQIINKYGNQKSNIDCNNKLGIYINNGANLVATINNPAAEQRGIK